MNWRAERRRNRRSAKGSEPWCEGEKRDRVGSNDASYLLDRFFSFRFVQFFAAVVSVVARQVEIFMREFWPFTFFFFVRFAILSPVKMWLLYFYRSYRNKSNKASHHGLCSAIVLCLYKLVEWYRSDLFYFVCAWESGVFSCSLLLPLFLLAATMCLARSLPFFSVFICILLFVSSTPRMCVCFLLSMFNAIRVVFCAQSFVKSCQCHLMYWPCGNERKETKTSTAAMVSRKSTKQNESKLRLKRRHD